MLSLWRKNYPNDVLVIYHLPEILLQSFGLSPQSYIYFYDKNPYYSRLSKGDPKTHLLVL